MLNKLVSINKTFVFGFLAAVMMTSGVVAVVGPTVEKANAASCRYYTYGYGSRGWCVQQLQILLKGPSWGTSGYFTKSLAVDGIYGQNTRAAVIKYQRNFPIANDGIVGPQTWGKICNPGFGSGGYLTSWDRIYNNAHYNVCR